MSIFEKAARVKLRFQSPTGGKINIEDLYDVGLKDVEAIHTKVAGNLETYTTGGFLAKTGKTKEQRLDELRKEILEHVMTVRQEEINDKLVRDTRNEEIRKLESLVAESEDKALRELSPEELNAKIAELKG